MTTSTREHAGPLASGRLAESVLVVANDPLRRAELARSFTGPDTRIVTARSPLEGLWSAPDVQTVVLDRGTDVDYVHL